MWHYCCTAFCPGSTDYMCHLPQKISSSFVVSLCSVCLSYFSGRYRELGCWCTHPLPRPSTWQRTSLLRSFSEGRAAGRGVSGLGPPLCPSVESAWGWALRQTWWARQPGSGTSSGESSGETRDEREQKQQSMKTTQSTKCLYSHERVHPLDFILLWHPQVVKSKHNAMGGKKTTNIIHSNANRQSILNKY